MVSALPAANDLGTLEITDLDLRLPDPQDEALSDHEFHQEVEQAWVVCDRFDLQTEIWRGRILRSVRDREKQKGDDRGAGFLNWLKEREITKSRAYSLIELANSADKLLAEGHLSPDTINQFSKRAFVETAQAAPEVQQLISDAAKEGKRINRQQVKRLADEWTAVTSDLIPEPVREKAASNHLPARYIAPLVREMEKLPEVHQVTLQAEVSDSPDIETVKQVTTSARYLSRYLESAALLRTLDQETLNLEQALEEALRLDCLNLAADLVSHAAQLEQAIVKFHTSWKRIRGLSERLYLESGSSTPHLRDLLTQLEALSGDEVTLPLGEIQDGRIIRFQVLEEG
jgi:hypothetical protein